MRTARRSATVGSWGKIAPMRSWQRWLEEEPEESKARTAEERFAELEAENAALRRALRSALEDLVMCGVLTKEVEPPVRVATRPPPTGVLRVLCKKCQTLMLAAELEDGECSACRRVEGRYR